MKLTLSLVAWTLLALAALYVLGPDTSRELPKPKPPPSKPAQLPMAPPSELLAGSIGIESSSLKLSAMVSAEPSQQSAGA